MTDRRFMGNRQNSDTEATTCENGPGQVQALLNAFQMHQAALKRFISRYLHNVQDIEDVAQEAFLRAYSTGRTTEIRQPKSLLFRIAKNIAVSELRLKSRKITDYIEDKADSNVLLTEGTVEDEVMARQLLGIHCEAVAALAPQCRRVYLMRKVYGMSHKEIAKRLGITVNTVRNHLNKGIELCDRYVRERTGDPSHAGTVPVAANQRNPRRATPGTTKQAPSEAKESHRRERGQG